MRDDALLTIPSRDVSLLAREGVAIIDGRTDDLAAFSTQLLTTMANTPASDVPLGVMHGTAVRGGPVLFVGDISRRCDHERLSPLDCIDAAALKSGKPHMIDMVNSQTHPLRLSNMEWQDHVWQTVEDTDAGLVVVNVEAPMSDMHAAEARRIRKFVYNLHHEADRMGCGVLVVASRGASCSDEPWFEGADTVMEIDNQPSRVAPKCLRVWKAPGLKTPLSIDLQPARVLSKDRVARAETVEYLATSDWSEHTVPQRPSLRPRHEVADGRMENGHIVSSRPSLLVGTRKRGFSR